MAVMSYNTDMGTTAALAVGTVRLPVANGIEVSKFNRLCVQANFDFGGGGTAAGNISIEVSQDNVKFTDYPDSSKAFTNTTDVHSYGITIVTFNYIRLKAVVSGGAGGTINAKLTGYTD